MYALGTTRSGEKLALTTEDRRRHIYLIGKSGTGKTTLLENLMLADYRAGRGFAYLDPHGDSAQRIAGAAPNPRSVVYLDPADLSHSVAFNVLENVTADLRAFTAAQVVTSFKSIWADSWRPRLEYVLTNSLRLLLDNNHTLLGLPRVLTDTAYRMRLLPKCVDPYVRQFWEVEFAGFNDRMRQEVISPIQNKIGALLAPPAIRNIVGQQRSTLDIPEIMNTGQYLVANLSKGRLGAGPAHLLGAFLTTAFAQAAEARAAIPEEERKDFTLYVDEFQNFATDSFTAILSEARKYRLSLVLGHQFLAQVPNLLRQAVIGNAGTMVVFRIGAEDAELLAPEFGLHAPILVNDPISADACERGIHSTQALMRSPNFHAWMKTLSHGHLTDPALISTPAEQERSQNLDLVRTWTRARRSRPRALVEKRIARFIAQP